MMMMMMIMAVMITMIIIFPILVQDFEASGLGGGQVNERNNRERERERTLFATQMNIRNIQ